MVSMVSSSLLLLMWLASLFAEVSGLAAYNDDAHRNRQQQQQHAAEGRVVEATMDFAGKMEVQPRRHHHKHHKGKSATSSEATSFVQRRYPFYHTSDDIHKEATRLSGSCGGMLNLTTVHDSGVSIDIITVRKAHTKPVNKVFILFGEHSRELISPESGLFFLRVLCGDATIEDSSLLESGGVAAILEDSEFQMVLNSNPRSRRKVEQGEFCLRTNPDGVDLNRNWDERWENTAASYSTDSNPGPKPFSEPETRLFKTAVTDYAPTTFLTVHSGTRGMYMPWAYDMTHLAVSNGPAMMDVLRDVDKGHCECPFGAAGKEVGYPCPGTCLDYAYGKLNTSFAFAFEIYTSHDADADLKQRWADKMKTGGSMLIDSGEHLGHPHFQDFFAEHSSDFVHQRKGTIAGEGVHSSLMRKEDPSSGVDSSGSSDPEAGTCFDMFNPGTQADYDKTVKNWAAAYIQMSTLIANKLKSSTVST